MTLLIDDKNIWSLTLASGKEYRRGDGHVHGIEVYEELGQSAFVPWFIVRTFGGHIIARVNAAYVKEVQYE